MHSHDSGPDFKPGNKETEFPHPASGVVLVRRSKAFVDAGTSFRVKLNTAAPFMYKLSGPHCFRKVVFDGPDNCFHVMRSIAVVDSHNTGEELGSCLESLPGCSVVSGGAIRE